MAYILETALNAYQSQKLQTELKKPTYGIIPFVKEGTGRGQIDDMTRQMIATANGRSVDISALKETTPSVATSFSYTIDANLGETAKTTVTIYNFWTGFHFNPYDFSNNAAAAEEYKMRKIEECDKALGGAVATQLRTIVNARRTQVLVATGAPSGFAFNTTSDSVTIANALKEKPFFDYINTILSQNEIDGEFVGVATPSLGYIIANHRLYGAANDKNLMGQAFPQIYMDTKMSVTAASDATMFMAKKGAIELVPSYPIEFLQNLVPVADTNFSVGSVELPMLGMKPLLYEERVKYDGSALTSRPTAAMTKLIKYGIGVSFGVVYSYNSDLTAKVNDIVKVELTTA